MDIENLFTEQKWNILHYLSSGDYSPMQLAQLANTTISNISQQLRLLEAAKLVRKKKISNRDKGKPRTIFSLSNDYAYLISVARNFAVKKFMTLTDYHKAMLKIWCVKNPLLHPVITEAYLCLLPKISAFDCIFLSESGEGVALNLVYKNSRDAKTESYLARMRNLVSDGFQIIHMSRESFNRRRMAVLQPQPVVLYDPNQLFRNDQTSGSDIFQIKKAEG